MRAKQWTGDHRLEPAKKAYVDRERWIDQQSRDDYGHENHLGMIDALAVADEADAAAGVHRVKLDDAATERVAAVLVQVESGGMCQYKKVCSLCDCGFKYDPAGIADRDKYAAEHAKLIINALKETP